MNNQNNKDVGIRIKKLRKEYLGNISQGEFGQKIGVTKTAISKLENGERNLTEQMAKFICREYKVDYLWLMEGIGDEPFIEFPDNLIDEMAEEYDLDAMDRRIIEEFVKLNKEQRAAIKTYIKKLV